MFTLFLANNFIFQVAQFFICEDVQCVYETLPPSMLVIMALVKIFTFYFNKQKVEYELYIY